MKFKRLFLTAALLATGINLASAEETELHTEAFEAIESWSWSTVSLSSNENWQANSHGDRNYAGISGWQADADSNDWLVSPAINLSGLPHDYAYVQFESAKNFSGDSVKLKVSTDYTDSVETATWTDISDMALWSGGSFSWADSGLVNLTDYAGESIVLAFHYTAQPSAAAEWQIDNLKVASSTDNPSSKITLVESFESDLGDWESISLASNKDWYQSSFQGRGFAKASGYNGDEPSNDWLVSPAVDMSEWEFPYFQFETAMNFSGDPLKVFIASDYAGDVTTANWIDLSEQVNWSEGGWAWVNSGRVDIAKLFTDVEARKTITIAFQYTSSEENGAATWEVDDVEMGSNSPAAFTPFSSDSNYLETFEEGFGQWTPVSLSGSKAWVGSDNRGASYVKMSGFRDDADSIDWLVSPIFDMSNWASQTIEFWSATKHDGPALQLLVSTDFAGNIESATWADISNRATWSEGNYDWAASGTIDISDFDTANLTFAFLYTANEDDGAATWQIESLSVGGATESLEMETNYTVHGGTEMFSADSSQWNWTAFSSASDKDWQGVTHIDKEFAEISGYNGDEFSSDWLVSPTIDMTTYDWPSVDWDKVFIEFSSATNYSGDALKLMVSTNYAGDVNAATWTDISDKADWSEGDWEWTESGQVDISEYIGQNVTIAFHYTSSDVGSATWRIDYARIIEEDDGFSDEPYEVEPVSGGGSFGFVALFGLLVLGVRRRLA